MPPAALTFTPAPTFARIRATSSRVAPAVEKPVLDDAICINVQNSCGVITGTNPRSVLIAVYRFLRENGCAFLNPGKNGECVPEKPLSELSAQISEAASSRS